MSGIVYSINKNTSDIDFQMYLLLIHKWSWQGVNRFGMCELKVPDSDRYNFNSFYNTFKHKLKKDITDIVIYEDRIRIYHITIFNTKVFSEYLSIDDIARITYKIITRYNIEFKTEIT